MKGKRLMQVGLALLLLLLTWASWEEPNLHNYTKPVQLLELQVAALDDSTQAATAQHQVAALPGVAACVINPHTQVATVLFHEDEVGVAEIERVLSVGGTFQITRPKMAPYVPTGRECPVPASYLAQLDRIRFALNLRRLFITV